MPTWLSPTPTPMDLPHVVTDTSEIVPGDRYLARISDSYGMDTKVAWSYGYELIAHLERLVDWPGAVVITLLDHEGDRPLTPNEVYEAPPVVAERLPSRIYRRLLENGFLPEPPGYDPLHSRFDDAHAEAGRVEVRWAVDECADGRRTCEVAGVFLDGHPFMLVRMGGRDGDEYADRFVTDLARYEEAAALVARLHVPDPAVTPPVDVRDPDEPIPELARWYGYDVLTHLRHRPDS